MKSIMWILAAGAVLLFSVVYAQEDSVSPDVPTGAPATESQSVANDNVRRAVFTTSVVDREPVDELVSIPSDADQICFFSEIVNLAGGLITHRWIHGGETMAEVTFDIGGPRWRVYSRKTLLPGQTGSWTVEVVDGGGNTLQRMMLDREDNPQEPAPVEDQPTEDE
jgi:hypothetical protein